MADAALSTPTSRRGLLAAAAALPMAVLALPRPAEASDLLTRVRWHNAEIDAINAAARLPDCDDDALDARGEVAFQVEDGCWNTVCRSREDCIAKLELMTHEIDGGVSLNDNFLSAQFKEMAAALTRAH